MERRAGSLGLIFLSVRKLVFKAFSLLVVASLLGCVGPTLYGPGSQSTRGGYEDSKLQDDQFNVAFNANGFTSPVRAKNYFLFRCAEITVQNGYDFFVIVSGDAIVNYAVLGSGAGAQTVSKPQYSGTIKLGKGIRPSENLNAYDARQIMKNIGPEIERQK
jgi:hypothetical protein